MYHFNLSSKLLTHNINLHMSNNPKTRLPQVLLAIKQKLNALLIQHLVLNEDLSDKNSDVIEYDHQCEGLEIIVDFVKTKQQNLVLKAYTSLRQYQPLKNRPTPKKTANTTTRRTYLNTTLSDASPIHEAQMHAIPSLKNDSSRFELDGSRANRSTVDLKQLLNRVKTARNCQPGAHSFHQPPNHISERVHHTSFHDYRQNQPSPMSTYLQHHRLKTSNPDCVYEQCRSQQMSKKNSRRQFILDKFSRIENTLHVIGEGKSSRGRLNNEILGEIYSIKERLRL